MSEIEITQADIAQAERHYPPSGWRREAILDLAQFVAEVRHEARAEALEEAAAMIDKFGDRHERDIAAGLKGAGKRTAHLDACRGIATAIRALRSGEREG